MATDKRTLGATIALAVAAACMPDAGAWAASQDGAACCGVIELRQYALHAGRRDDLIELFEREFVESQETLGMRLPGLFRDLDDPDRFVWLRGFPDMQQRAQALEAFYTGPVWRAHRDAANATMIDADDVLLLRPLRPEGGFRLDDAVPPPGAAAPSALIEARIYHFDTMPAPPALTRHAVGLAAALRDAGADVLAAFVTEPAKNTFPRLPVREGESVLAVFSRFRDRAAHDAFMARLAASEQWRSTAETLRHGSPRPPQILRLQPTARSRLR